MRVPWEWLGELVDLPESASARSVADALTRVGLAVESIDRSAAPFTGPVVIGRVLAVEELTGLRKPIRYCAVDVGAEHGGTRSIICGAPNVAEAAHVVVALPGSVLPGGVAIAERTAYRRTSQGMICSGRELGVSDEQAGILILDPSDTPMTVGEPAARVLGFDDPILVVGVTPDRGYALSMRGIAREVGLALDVPFHDPVSMLHPGTGSTGTGSTGTGSTGTGSTGTGWTGPADAPTVPMAEAAIVASATIAAAEGADRLVLRTLTGLTDAASPAWLSRRLRACGMRSISAAVDITNYVMLELGQPLHAFDRSRVSGGLTARWAVAGERLQTLDGIVRELSPADLVIADDRGPLALAGVMGGASSEVTADTEAVILEAAHFLPVAIARSSRRHRLTTEASRRFERGVDPQVAQAASVRAAGLLADVCGAATVGVAEAGVPAVSAPIVIAAGHPGAVAGMPIGADEVRSRLISVGCAVADVAGDGERLTVTAPSWRPDLSEPADLVEEVLRLRGYDELPATLPVGRGGRGFTLRQRRRQQVGRLLAGMGAVEVLTYPFTGPISWQALGLPPDDERRQAVRLANPLSEERPFLRTEMISGLLEVAHRNNARGNGPAVIVECGPVMRPRPGMDGPVVHPAVDRRPTAAECAALDALLPEQPLHLGLLDWSSGEWAEPIRWIADLAADLGCTIAVEPTADAPFHPGRAALVRLAGGQVLGHAGQLHPEVCAAYGLPPASGAAEIDLDRLLDAATEVIAAPLSSHPVAKEDLAFVVADDIASEVVARAIRDGVGPLIESVTLFDAYRGPQIPAGLVSLAFTLRLRAPDRTLSPAEIRAARQAALDAAARVGAQLREEA